MAPVLFFSIEGNRPDINVVGTILRCVYRECFMLRQMKGNFVKNRGGDFETGISGTDGMQTDRGQNVPSGHLPDIVISY